MAAVVMGLYHSLMVLLQSSPPTSALTMLLRLFSGALRVGGAKRLLQPQVLNDGVVNFVLSG